MIILIKMIKMRKVKIELDEDLVVELNKRKNKVGETYSDVVRFILKK